MADKGSSLANYKTMQEEINLELIASVYADNTFRDRRVFTIKTNRPTVARLLNDFCEKIEAEFNS